MIEKSKSIFELWSEEFVSGITFSKYCRFDFRGCVINPKLSQKGLRLVFHAPVVIEGWDSIVKETLRWSICFWNHYLKIRGDGINPKMGQKVQTGISCTNIDIKMKIKGKRNFEVNYLFMKPFVLSVFWRFEASWWRHQPKIGSKRGPNSYITC